MKALIGLLVIGTLAAQSAHAVVKCVGSNDQNGKIVEVSVGENPLKISIFYTDIQKGDSLLVDINEGNYFEGESDAYGYQPLIRGQLATASGQSKSKLVLRTERIGYPETQATFTLTCKGKVSFR